MQIYLHFEMKQNKLLGILMISDSSDVENLHLRLWRHLIAKPFPYHSFVVSIQVTLFLFK